MTRKTTRSRLERELVKQGYSFEDGVIKPPAKSTKASEEKKPPVIKAKPAPAAKDPFPAKIIENEPHQEPGKEGDNFQCGACGAKLAGAVSPCPECGKELTWSD